MTLIETGYCVNIFKNSFLMANQLHSALPSNNQILSSSLFLVSEFNRDNGIFSSRKCNFSQLSANFIDNVENHPVVNIDGKWAFKNNLSAIVIETTSITMPESVINEEYLSANFSKLFNKLSSDLFSKKFRLPSYVGQVILGTTLKNETIIQKYYGTNTRWKQLPGRFLMPVSNTNINGVSLNRTGVLAGASYHEFSIKDLNPHTHNFEGGEGNKKISHSYTYCPLEGVGKIVNVYKTDDVRYYSNTFPTGNGAEYYPSIYTAMPITLVFAGGWCTPWERGGVTSKRIYGIGKDKIKISPINSKVESKTFTKLPPFYSVYIWQRIS